MNIWRLHYFHIYGRAEQIRILFNLQKTKFEDIRYTSDEWKSGAKQSLGGEFHQLPLLEKVDPVTGEVTKYA